MNLVESRRPVESLKPVTIQDANWGVHVLPWHTLHPWYTHKAASVHEMLSLMPRNATEIVESSSGNTGIVIAQFAKALGKKVTLFLLEGQTPEKKKMLQNLGVDVREYPLEERLSELSKHIKGKQEVFFTGQFHNERNHLGHQMSAHKIDNAQHFVAAAGTYGTVKGYSDYFRRAAKQSTVIELQEAPHMYNKSRNRKTEFRSHGLPGIGPTFIPNIARQATNISSAALVTADKCRELFEQSQLYGLDFGLSSALNLAIAKIISEQTGLLVGTVTFDHINRYVPERELHKYSFDIKQVTDFLRNQSLFNSGNLILDSL